MPEIPIPSPPTLFGLKVANVSASMGWGGQGGSCTLSLIDEGTPPLMPAVGTACGFIFDQFSFAGHLQRHQYKESLSGRFYDVTLESPAKLLDGVQIILSDFERGFTISGATPDAIVSNVWNPYAEQECYFHGGIFGGSGGNDSGYPISELFGQLVGFGQGIKIHQTGKMKFGESEYTIDFSDLFSVVQSRAPFYRVKGPVISLNGLLQDLAEVAQVDYFVQCRATNNGAIVGPAELKVRIADRAIVASGVIESYVDGIRGTGELVSASLGEELQDVATGRMLVGGPASRYIDCRIGTALSSIAVWGKFSNGSYANLGFPAIAYSDLNFQLPVILDEFSGTANYTATIFELRMALGGQETWETFKAFQIMAGVEPNGFTLANNPFVGAVEANSTTLNKIVGGSRDAIDLAVTSKRKSSKAYQDALKRQAQYYFNGVSKTASSFYGQVFMSVLPAEPGGINNNLRWIEQPYSYEASWEISESAWPSVFPTADANFYDGEGKLKSASVFPASVAMDYSPLGGDYAHITTGEIATTKGGPDKDIFWVGGTPFCITRSGAQIRHYDSITTPDFGLTVLAQHFFGLNITPDKYIGPGKPGVQIPIPPAVALPNTIGVPQESNRYTWGPWFAFTADNGKAEVDIDSSLRPETYGSVAGMDAVGFGSVFAGLAQMGAVEQGNVELAQVPQFNMGDRFTGAGPYVTSMDISIGVDGCKTSYKFSTWTPNFGKLAKYNADRLAKVNKASIAFMKESRARVKKRPFPKIKFEKTQFNFEANGGERFNARKGMEVFNGMFRNL